MWLGLSHCSPARLLRMVAKEVWHGPKAISLEVVGLRPTRRRSLHVRLAHHCQSVDQTRRRITHPAVYESSRHDPILGDFSHGCGSHTFSFHLRFYDGLLSGSERFLHLRLSLRRVL